jgi:hypothetical protein
MRNLTQFSEYVDGNKQVLAGKKVHAHNTTLRYVVL